MLQLITIFPRKASGALIATWLNQITIWLPVKLSICDQLII